ncbi:MAG: hypothetical protein JXR73_21320 [Candidatus Omnitrophica bacterium]|nr:hypothetical protein [Candidatus Omnitrophota bacterium]
MIPTRDVVTKVFRDCGCNLTVIEPGRAWQCHLSNGADIPVSVHAEDPWLTMRESRSSNNRNIQSMQDNRLFHLLSQNSSMHGCAKYVLEEDGGIRVKAEIPLWDGEHLSKVLEKSIQGLIHAIQVVSEPQSRSNPPQRQTNGCRLSSRQQIQLVETIERAGGKIIQGSKEEIWIDLESQSTYAKVNCGDEEDFRIYFEILSADHSSPIVHRSLMMLLLIVSRVVKMVRAFVMRENRRTKYYLEAPICFRHDPRNWEYAIASLELAGRLCKKEMMALSRNEALARDYMAFQGFDAEASI